MTPERQRSTLVHELAHIFCLFPDDMDEDEAESFATAISGAFLCPAKDLLRELGPRRTHITSDMDMVAQEYGVSMLSLIKRANILGIINDSLYKQFMIEASKRGWRKHEPSRIAAETASLFEMLTTGLLARTKSVSSEALNCWAFPMMISIACCMRGRTNEIHKQRYECLDRLRRNKCIALPFRLDCVYFMSKDAIEDEWRSPKGRGTELLALGLQPVCITTKEFYYAVDIRSSNPRLSAYDAFAWLLPNFET